GQRGGNGHGLEGIEPPGQQQGGGHHPLRGRPEHPLPHRGRGGTPRRQGIDHQRSGVRRGDKKGNDQQYGEKRNDSGEGQYFIEPEQSGGVVRLDIPDQRLVALVHDQVQGGVAKNGKPQKREDGGHQHHPHHELANGAPAADSRDKQPDKGRPGDGPAKDEQGPVADPVAAGIGLQIKGALHDIVEVTAGILQKALEDVDAGPHRKDKQHQGNRQHHIDNGQALDPLVQTGHYRQDCQPTDDGDGDDLYGDADGNLRPQVIDTGIDLGDRQPQGGGDTKHGAENGKHIHHMADGSIDLVADKRIQGGAHRQRQAVTEGKVGQHQ